MVSTIGDAPLRPPDSLTNPLPASQLPHEHDIVHSSERLKNRIHAPETIVNISDELILLFKVLDSQRINGENSLTPDGFKLLHEFIYHLEDRLDKSHLSEIFMRAASSYYPPFINSCSHLTWEPIWLTCKILNLDPYNQSPRDKLNAWELDLCNHPHIDQLLRSAAELKVGSLVHKLKPPNTDLMSFEKQLTKYISEADNIAKEGAVLMARSMYGELMRLIRESNSSFIQGQKQRYLAQLEKRHSQCSIRPAWDDFRKRFQNLKSCSQSLEAFSSNLSALLTSIFTHVHNLIGTAAPCSYEVLLVSTSTLSICSDFDIAFLIANEGGCEVDQEVRKLFITRFLPAYLALVRFYLVCLDDQAIIDKSLVRIGCDLDDSELPHLLGFKDIALLERRLKLTDNPVVLVNSPEGFVDHVTNPPARVGSSDMPMEPLLGLIHSRSIFKPMRQVSLLEEYKDRLGKRLKELPIATHILSQILCNYKPPDLNFYLQKGKIDLKHGWRKPFMVCCFNLSHYLGWFDLNTVDAIIERLRTYLPPYFHMKLKNSWERLEKMRWELQITRKGKLNEGQANEINLNFLPPQQIPSIVETLEEIASSVLNPLGILIAQIKLNLNHLADPSVTSNALHPASNKFPDAFEFFPSLIEQHFNRPLGTESYSNSLESCLTLLRKRNIPLFESNTPQDSPTKDTASLIDLIQNMLFSDFQQRPYHSRGNWLERLLQIDLLFAIFDPNEIQHMIDTLLCIPTDSGKRLGEDLELLQFCISLKTLFTSNVDETYGFKITLRDLDDPFSYVPKTYFLKKDISDQFLDLEGRFKPYKSAKPSLHTVVPLKTAQNTIFCWIKVCPENFSMEEFSRNMAWGLGKGDLPPSLAGKLEGPPGILPILLIQHAEGVSWADANVEIDRISPPSFTRNLLRVFVTKPEDDKPEDILIKPRGNTYELRCIDNERQFCKAVDKGLLKDVLMLKSILLFHEAMKRPLDQDTLQAFLSISPLKLAKRLLESVEQMHLFLTHPLMFNLNDMNAFYKPKHAEQRWNIRVSDISILSGVVTKQWLLKWLSNLQALYDACLTPHLVGDDLLKTLLASAWTKIIRAWNTQLPGKEHPSLERFNSLKLYEIDEHGNRSSKVSGYYLISQAQGVKFTDKKTLQYAHGKKFCIYMQEDEKKREPVYDSCKNIFDNFAKTAFEEALKKLEAEEPSFVRLFCNLFAQLQSTLLNHVQQHRVLTRSQELLILQALAQTRAKINHLNLSPFRESVTDALLNKILKKHGRRLLTLKLSGCHALTPASVEDINKNCPNLKELVLVGCPLLRDIQITKIEGLSRLEIGKISSIYSIILCTPYLQTLSMHNIHYFSIQFSGIHLRDITLINCKSLAYKVAEMIKNPFELKKFDCVGCLKPWQETALKKYPFLIHWIGFFTQKVTLSILAALDRLTLEKVWEMDLLKKEQHKNLSTFLDKIQEYIKARSIYLVTSFIQFKSMWMMQDLDVDDTPIRRLDEAIPQEIAFRRKVGDLTDDLDLLLLTQARMTLNVSLCLQEVYKDGELVSYSYKPISEENSSPGSERIKKPESINRLSSFVSNAFLCNIIHSKNDASAFENGVSIERTDNNKSSFLFQSPENVSTSIALEEKLDDTTFIEISNLLRDKSPEVRAKVVLEIADSETSESLILQELKLLLQDPDPYVQGIVVEAFERLSNCSVDAQRILYTYLKGPRFDLNIPYSNQKKLTELALKMTFKTLMSFEKWDFYILLSYHKDPFYSILYKLCNETK